MCWIKEFMAFKEEFLMQTRSIWMLFVGVCELCMRGRPMAGPAHSRED